MEELISQAQRYSNSYLDLIYTMAVISGFRVLNGMNGKVGDIGAVLMFAFRSAWNPSGLSTGGRAGAEPEGGLIFSGMNTMRPFLYSLIVLLALQLQAQNDRLRSGPMLGYADMTEALIWVQATGPAEVWAEYREGEADPQRRTEAVRTRPDRGFTAKLIATGLQPGRTYTYRILVEGVVQDLPYPAQFSTQPLWQWRTDPPEFTLATGSCTYINEEALDRPGRAFGGDYQIFEAIHQAKPDLMLWLGDNTYLREADWGSRSGIYHRYSHTRALPELQPLLAACPHYAIWDDHDYGPNDSDRSFIHKAFALEAFRDFWGNPTSGLPGQEGITTAFTWGGIDFFLLDNRWFRNPNDCQGCEATILGEAQREWLIEALVASRAPFKMVAVGGQVLNPAPTSENFANRHAAEREWLLRRIEEENIQGVVFLTGDRHHTELSAWQNGMGNWVYDLTVSPLTSSAGRHNEREGNSMRVTGTYVNQRNFALLTFSGARHQRVLTIQVRDAGGNPLWRRRIEQPGKK
jgi:alkaline phosphatase D